MKVFDDIINIIKSREKFILVSHTSPDGDAVGSIIGMYFILKKLGKEVIPVLQDEVPERYRFLKGWENIKTPDKLTNIGSINDFTGIMLDSANPDRTGTAEEIFSQCSIKIEIDHHQSNTFFADYCWVDKDIASTTQMVYMIAKNLINEELPEEIAFPIFNGIYTDTGGFAYPNTDGTTLKIAAELVDRGVKPHVIANNVYNNEPFVTRKLLGKLIYNIETYFDCRAAVMTMTYEDLKEFNLTEVNTEHFVNNARAIKGVEIGAFLREENNRVRCSLRSKGKVDADKIARHFGGGGHAEAAGFRVYNKNIEDVKNELLQIIEKNI